MSLVISFKVDVSFFESLLKHLFESFDPIDINKSYVGDVNNCINIRVCFDVLYYIFFHEESVDVAQLASKGNVKMIFDDIRFAPIFVDLLLNSCSENRNKCAHN